MKKKTLIIIVIVFLLVILLTPVKISLKDGGTVKFCAVLYELNYVHSLHVTQDGRMGYLIGKDIRILFFDVYNDVRFVESP